MAKLLDGRKTADEIFQEQREQIESWTKQGGHRAPQLTTIAVGEDESGKICVREAVKAADKVGIDVLQKRFSADISEEQLLKLIEALNEDDAVDGIFVLIPLPEHIDVRKVGNAISCDKDVDGFNERNIGRLSLDMHALNPCNARGIKELIKRYAINTLGKNAVVVGRSKLIGMPIAMMLHTDGRHDARGMDATVTICHTFTPPEELARFCRMADIIVTATGTPGLIKADMVKEGACIIDAGLSCVKDPVTGKNKWVGDVDFEEVRQVAGYITPIPGGVGPMCIAMLMRNTFTAAQNLARKKNEQQH